MRLAIPSTDQLISLAHMGLAIPSINALIILAHMSLAVHPLIEIETRHGVKKKKCLEKNKQRCLGPWMY